MDIYHLNHSSQLPRQRHRRTGKRRLNKKTPVAARIALNSQLRGHVGVLSEDLANDLFSQETLQGEQTSILLDGQ